MNKKYLNLKIRFKKKARKTNKEVDFIKSKKATKTSD